jgi:hypothetical protein
MKEKEYIIIHETILRSWARDVSSVVCFVTLIGIGVFLDSNAMQWCGAILGFLTLATASMKMVGNNSYTIEEARKRLDELERKAR